LTGSRYISGREKLRKPGKQEIKTGKTDADSKIKKIKLNPVVVLLSTTNDGHQSRCIPQYQIFISVHPVAELISNTRVGHQSYFTAKCQFSSVSKEDFTPASLET
jgi:hypothetical protein